MLDVYNIWLYPLQDWYKTVNEMSDFMYTGQMENFIFRPVDNLETRLQPLSYNPVFLGRSLHGYKASLALTLS